jgi:hypothetical protein
MKRSGPNANKESVAHKEAVMGTKEKQTIAGYFGLAVEVLNRMASYSLIRYRERVFIVETLDLDSCWRLGWGVLDSAGPFIPESKAEIKAAAA